MPVKQSHEGAIARAESAGATVGATQLQHVLTYAAAYVPYVCPRFVLLLE